MTTELTRRGINWGLPDALFVWVGAGMIGVFASLPVATAADIDPLYTFGVLLPVQQFASLGALVLVSRAKGRGSLRSDFGLEVRAADYRVLGLGPLLQGAFWLALLPLVWLGGDTGNQQLVEELERTREVLPVVLFAIGAVVMAPIVEETLYRGLLFRALLRRVSPGTSVFVSALIFAAVHFVGDPNALRSLPALATLGVILALQALRTGSLSSSILIHAGFNLTTTVLVLLAPDNLS
ncbi:MAG: lysostaphin resistance A-like protein [Acidimicrobiia bacterium]